MPADDRRSGRAAVSGAGMVHIRLYYRYLDLGDIDGLGSLVHVDVRLERPEQRSVRGGRHVLAALREISAGRHHIDEMVTGGDQIAVEGRFHGVGRQPLVFGDFFGLSPEGLVLSIRRYHLRDV